MLNSSIKGGWDHDVDACIYATRKQLGVDGLTEMRPALCLAGFVLVGK